MSVIEFFRRSRMARSALGRVGRQLSRLGAEAVAGNEDLWRDTVFVINDDENDGFFDRTVPPLPSAGTVGEFVHVAPGPNSSAVKSACRGRRAALYPVRGYIATEQFDFGRVRGNVVRSPLEKPGAEVRSPNTPWRR